MKTNMLMNLQYFADPENYPNNGADPDNSGQGEPNDGEQGNDKNVQELLRRVHNLETKNKNLTDKLNLDKHDSSDSVNPENGKYVPLDKFNALNDKIDKLVSNQTHRTITEKVSAKAKKDGIELNANDLNFIISDDEEKTNKAYDYIKSLKASKGQNDGQEDNRSNNNGSKPPKNTKHDNNKPEFGALVAKNQKKSSLSDWFI